MNADANERTLRDESTEDRKNLWSIIERAASRAPTEHPEDEDLHPRSANKNENRLKTN